MDAADRTQGQLYGRLFDSLGTAVGDEVQLSVAGADGSYSFFQRGSGAFVFAYANNGDILGRTFTQVGK